MYLNNKQIIQLLAPFLLGIVLLFFQDNIVNFMYSQLPKPKSIKDKNFYNDVNEYLKIQRDMYTYNAVTKKIKEREKSSQWITANVLYQKQLAQSKNESALKKQKQFWHLEAVFPKHNMAIMNAQFVHKGSFIDNAKIIQIKFDSVLLKTKKGLKWVHLFH